VPGSGKTVHHGRRSDINALRAVAAVIGTAVIEKYQVALGIQARYSTKPSQK
jgi:hypothetical protein